MNYKSHKLGALTVVAISSMELYRRGIFTQYRIDIPFIYQPDSPITQPQFLKESSIFLPIILYAGAALWASTLPDIDHTQSVPGKRHPKISRWMNSHFGHRGLTHYPITLLMMCFLIYIGWLCLPMEGVIKNGYLWIFSGYAVGYASHILLDTLNSAGVSLLMPFSKVRIKIPTGIRFKKRSLKPSWRYLQGGNALDNFILGFLCCGGVVIEFYRCFIMTSP